MAVYDQGARRAFAARPLYAYIAALLVILVILAGAATMWSATDNSGTNVLSGDSQSTTPPAPLSAPQ